MARRLSCEPPQGNFPLFQTAELANAYSSGDGSSHAMTFGMYTLYMPNGADDMVMPMRRRELMAMDSDSLSPCPSGMVLECFKPDVRFAASKLGRGCQQKWGEAMAAHVLQIDPRKPAVSYNTAQREGLLAP